MFTVICSRCGISFDIKEVTCTKLCKDNRPFLCNAHRKFGGKGNANSTDDSDGITKEVSKLSLKKNQNCSNVKTKTPEVDDECKISGDNDDFDRLVPALTNKNISTVKMKKTVTTPILSFKEKAEKLKQQAESLRKSQDAKDRRNKVPVQDPVRRNYSLPIYCNGGKRCGYEINYSYPSNLPSTCCPRNTRSTTPHDVLDDKNLQKCTKCMKIIAQRDRSNNCTRAEHVCGWDYMMCAHNGCILFDEYRSMSPADIDKLFYYHCCTICGRGVHGGVSNNHGVIFH